jgi:uncharacterized membrane protein HdeD (DUF308 family)
MSKYWWVYLLQGIVTLILGGLLLFKPGLTLMIIVLFLGVYWLVSGVFSLFGAFTSRGDGQRGWMLGSGLLGIIAGLVVIVHPLIVSILAPAILIMLIGFLGIVIGGIGLVQAFKGGGWAAALWGTLAVIFGLILIFNPLIGVEALPWILGVVALIAGLALIVVAIRLRKG